MSNSVRPQRRQPTRLPHPWDSPGENTGVGCHFLLQCMKVKSESEVIRSCPTPSNPMDCNLPGSSVHGMYQARNLSLSQITAAVLILLCSRAFFFSCFGHPLTRSISPVSLLAADCCFALLGTHIINFSTCFSFSLTVDHMPCSAL